MNRDGDDVYAIQSKAQHNTEFVTYLVPAKNYAI